jgi:glycosyltransferase involved in cell wall biosynthesis
MTQDVLVCKAKRIAFPLVGGRAGSGSYNYILNLVRALSAYSLDRLVPVIFAGEDVSDGELAPFRAISGAEIVRSGCVTAQQSWARMIRAVSGSDATAAKLFLKYRIDAVFEQAMYFGARFPIPVIVWITDFQHRKLPDLFRPTAWWRRELGYRAQIHRRGLIMLSSEDSRRDCEWFYPQTVGKTAVVRFAVMMDAESLSLKPKAVARAYGLPEGFLYLPNQFWKHKNHEVVIEATGMLKREGHNVVVATTGVAGDARHPQHYMSLQQSVRRLGIEDNFRFLGLVPRQHVIALMQSCAALINPSLFEGWSTSVEEAKTLGVPMILSDLAVHREQVDHGARFFNPRSAVELKHLMGTAELILEERGDIERVAVASSVERVRRFCEEFICAAERAIRGG